MFSPSGALLAWMESAYSNPLVVTFNLQQRKVLRKFALGAENKLNELR